MLVSDFDFDLPDELIAQRPPEKRDQSRMLVVGADNGIADSHIRNFLDYLRPGDVVVMNDSKVVPCRFAAGEFEFTLHTMVGAGGPVPRSLGEGGWAFAKKFNRLNIGDKLKLADGTEIEIADKNDDSGVLIRFGDADVFGVLERVGKIPLPPYIKREPGGDDDNDRERYQTVYAKNPGSMAAPTAGLHFTNELLDEVKRRAKVVNITLHVGAGTWMPVKSADTNGHKMHREFGTITQEQAEIINGGKRVIAVGTTTLRLLEAAGGRAFSGATDIFITPGYRFKVADALLTNFHLPKSTLFMLVCAFAGMDEMRRAYAHAILEKYRFFSYGDCCLLFRRN